MALSKTGKSWLKNFRNCPLVKQEVFNKDLANKLFKGFQNEEILPFSKGFRQFHDNFDSSNSEKELDELLRYLNFIGITIKKQSIINIVEKGVYTYAQILKKAFYIFKQLANHDGNLDINDPYRDNIGDFFFFLRIEENVNTKQLVLFDELELPEFYGNYIKLPECYENDETAKKLFDLIENSTNCFFLTGKAGTGKSTFIQYFTKKTKKQVLLIAFTGIAAINIGGQTIHSFFRFPFKPLLPDDPEIPIFNDFDPNRKILETTDTIIIDEVSMLRSDILEGLDFSLRKNGGNPSKTFGGKQIIFVGDIFQLPPVVNSNDEVEDELFKSIYKSEYFFDSLSYKKQIPIYYEFEKIHRQQEPELIELLNKIRNCSIDIVGITKLNERYNPNYAPNWDEFAIMLTTNNTLAKDENAQKLTNLPYRSHFFEATIAGDFPEDRYPTESILQLKRNAQVMLIKNDSVSNGRRWVNGTIAKVEFIEDDKIEIKLKDGSIHVLQKEIWENRKYSWDKRKGRITSKVIGTFQQYPIKLAWAITIHKSQGLTFENVIVDLGTGTFVNGQLYTALSRCKTFEGITLKRKVNLKDIIEDRRLIEFYERHIKNSTMAV